jgi:IS30 family transposase
MDRPEIRQYVLAKLREYWSPDQIDGRRRLEFPAERWRRVCRQTIYKFLGIKVNRARWGQYLREGPRPKARAERTPRKTGIASRPNVINRRERFGDWEGDTMLGTRHRSDGGLVVLVERRSGYLEADKVPDRRSDTVMKAIQRQLQRHPAELRRSCTFDNGPEFTLHEVLKKKLGVETYFADPHSPWQRGTNENTIRLLRQFFPKGMPLRDVSHGAVARAKEKLNDRPRKRLGYRTPNEVHQELASVAILD